MWDYCSGAPLSGTDAPRLAASTAVHPHLAMLLVLLLAPALGSNPVCDIFNASRVWWTTGDCVVQGQTIDLSESDGQDLSVVNLFGEMSRNPNGKYHAVQFRDATLKGGKINLDLNLTLSDKDTNATVFDLQSSSFESVVVHGTITVHAGCEKDMTLNLTLFDQAQSKSDHVTVLVECESCSGLVSQEACGYQNLKIMMDGNVFERKDSRPSASASTTSQQIYDRLHNRSTSVSLEHAVSSSSSAFADYYREPLKYVQEVLFEISGLQESYFDTEAQTVYLVQNAARTRRRFFYGLTKVVFFADPFHFTACDGQYYDPESAKCVDNCMYGSRKNAVSMVCVPTCPNGMAGANGLCGCPAHTGYRNNNCSDQCPASQYVSGAQCVTACNATTNKYIFKRSCVKKCPPGTLVMGSVCEEPQSYEACRESYSSSDIRIAVFPGFPQLYNRCVTTAPAGMYWDRTTNRIVPACRYTGIDGTCTYMNSICGQGNTYLVSDGTKCRNRCVSGSVLAPGERVCRASCPDYYYETSFQTCNQCESAYDGGIYFDRATKKCV